MNIYIKVEIKKRDFFPRALIGAFSALHKNDVFIGDGIFFENIRDGTLNPGIILEKSISNVNQRNKQLIFYKKKKFKVTSLDEEGGLNVKKYRDFAFKRFSNKNLSLVEKIFCWGEYDYKKNIQLFKDFKEKFIKTGNPRFDYINFIKRKKIKIKRHKKKIIIVPSFFTIARSYRIADNLYRRRKVKNRGLANEKAWMEYTSLKSKETFDLLSLIYEIKEKFKKLEMEIWVHPKENIDNWKKIIPEDNTLKYRTDKNFESISSKDTLFIHSGSTLVLDIMMMNFMVYYFRPIKNSFNQIPVFNLSKIANKKKKILEIIKNFYFTRNFKSKKINNNLGKYIHNFDSNILASKEISNYFEKLKNKDLSLKNKLFKNNVLKLYLKNYFRSLRYKINKKIYNPKFPPITKNEIHNLKLTLTNFDKKFKNLKIELIGPTLIRMRHK
tara:strand:- start:2045 stop:3367 length:1323 start_codon:yes stop_codon:yes gene_type:complete